MKEQSASLKCYYRYKENPEWVASRKIKYANWYATPEGRICSNLHRRKREALKKNPSIDTSILLEDLLPLPTHCYILGIEINYGPKGSHGARDNSPSIDRINPAKGYTKGNVQIISQRANQLKSDGTLEEMLLIVEHLKGIKNV